MKEKDLQRLFTNYMAEKEIKESTAWELKLEKGNCFSFNKVADHQIEALKMAKGKGIYYKINDAPIFSGNATRFTNAKPFDCFYLSNAKAYIAICFYTPRKLKEIFLIDIDKFVKEKETSERKSLTKNRAKEISEEIITL